MKRMEYISVNVLCCLLWGDILKMFNILSYNIKNNPFGYCQFSFWINMSSLYIIVQVYLL